MLNFERKINTNKIMHIGELIRAEFLKHEKSHSATWFAQQLNCNRANIYNIFSRSSIDTELLYRISKVLDHNFFKDLSEDYEQSESDIETT